VVAELAGREPVWQAALEGFNAQESKVIRGWRKEGSLETARAAVVKVLAARFPGVPVPAGVRVKLEKSADVGQLTEWLAEAALTASPADFERSLAAAD
jgi:hypothetical protein